MASLEHIKGKYIEFCCFPTTFFPSPKFDKVRLRDEKFSKSFRVEELPSRILKKYLKVGIFAKNRQSPNFCEKISKSVRGGKYFKVRNSPKYVKVPVPVFRKKYFQSPRCRVLQQNISKFLLPCSEEKYF